MPLRRSRQKPPTAGSVQVKPPITARITAARGMANHYRDAISTLMPSWKLLVPFLLWQAHSAYHGELERQRRKLAQKAEIEEQQQKKR